LIENQGSETSADCTVFIYVIDGKGKAGNADIDNGTLGLFDSGDQFSVKASDEPFRFLLITGKPLKEPVAWEGPIVKNTQEQLQTALNEYSESTFIKHK